MSNRDEIDLKLAAWADRIEAEIIEKSEKRYARKRFVINLSDPQRGDIFRMMDDEVWQIEQVIPYRGNVLFNQSMLVIRKPRGKKLYTVPHRLNGNIERRTISPIEKEYVRRLILPKSMRGDLPADIIAVYHYAQASEDSEIKSYGDVFVFHAPVYEYASKEDGSLIIRQAVPEIVRWAINLIGGEFDNQIGFFDLEEIDTSIGIPKRSISEDNDEDTESNPKFIGLHPVQFSVQPLDKDAEPDVMLIDSASGHQSATIYPHDIERSVQTLLRYFEPNELIDLIEQMKDS